MKPRTFLGRVTIAGGLLVVGGFVAAALGFPGLALPMIVPGVAVAATTGLMWLLEDSA